MGRTFIFTAGVATIFGVVAYMYIVYNFDKPSTVVLYVSCSVILSVLAALESIWLIIGSVLYYKDKKEEREKLA